MSSIFCPFNLLIGETIGLLILKWAHTASSFARLNFGDSSKLGGTRENWPKISYFLGENAIFKKSSKC